MNETAISGRRYDIDWLRVISIWAMLAYHVVVVFQPFAVMFGFLQSETSLESLWVPMSFINIWRGPLLFAVSGMAVAFAMRRRDWKTFLGERTRRILLPLAFGSFAIVPLQVFIFQDFYGQPLSYRPLTAHLWFLANLYAYALLLTPVLFYLRRNPENALVRGLRWLLGKPFLLPLLSLPFILEAEIVRPMPFALYAGSEHGFWIGFVAFFMGFCFLQAGDAFWGAARVARFPALVLATGLFATRVAVYNLEGPSWFMAFESMTWLIAIFGLAHANLNRPGPLLRYLSDASFPVYIIHMPVLYAAAAAVLPLYISTWLQFVLITVLTFVGSAVIYHLLIRHVSFLRPLFGLRREV